MLYRALIGPLVDGLRRAARSSRVRSSANGVGGLGLALGGGFARGFAHLGVLQVLDDNKIPVSCIAGTSVGSILGAAYASGLPPQRIAAVCRRIHFRDFARWRLSRLGLASNERMGELIRRWFGTLRFDDMRIPFAAVTTDLCSGEPWVLTAGDLVSAIRASCAYPGLFEPVLVDGRCLADGGLVAQVPTEAAASLGPRWVMGVSVEFKEWGRAAPKNLFQVISRAIGAAQKHRSPSWRDFAHLRVEPEVGHFEWDAFDRADQIIAAGAAAMRRELPRLRALMGLAEERRGVQAPPMAQPGALSPTAAD
jgi:NTE family protein